MSHKKDKEPCRSLLVYCHETIKGIKENVMNNAVLNSRLALINYEQIMEGLAAFNQIENSRQDEGALRNALRDAEKLLTQFETDLRARMDIFLLDAVVKRFLEKQEEDMYMFTMLSKYVLTNGHETHRREVIEIWTTAKSHAEKRWRCYQRMEREIEDDARQFGEAKRQLTELEGKVRNDLSWDYGEQDLKDLILLAWRLRRIRMGETRYELTPDQMSSKKSAIDGVWECCRRVNQLGKIIRDEQIEKQKASVDRLRMERRNASHVKYEIRITVAKADFSKNVYILKGQQPLFCAARRDPVEPPHATGFSNWAPPTLEARLETTNNPQTIILKELRYSSKEIHGASGEDITIILPQKRGSAYKTTRKRDVTFGGTGRSHNLRVTCTRKGEETCTEYPCKEPEGWHWINSGDHKMGESSLSEPRHQNGWGF